jgi:glyoxylase-like metal-dependent hydrolase (beta-lactamase superfamily II)
VRYSVTAVRYGTRVTTRSDAYHRHHVYGEPDAPLRIDYFFWLLEGPETIVVDCGFDPEVGARLGRECLCPPAEALARLGVDAGRVGRVVLTHLHYDHIGNLDLFPQAELVVARRDLEFWSGPYASRPHLGEFVVPDEVARVRQAEREGRVRLVDGDGEVAPGVQALCVGGHSPGQLVLVVGETVLAGDVIHYYEELERDRPFAIFVDLAELYAGYDALRALGPRTLVAGHDPLVMERFPRLDGECAELAVRVG